MNSKTIPSFTEYLAPGEPLESLPWRIRIINRCRWFSNQIWHHWYALHKRIGYVEANLWLTQLEKRLMLGGTGLYIFTSDSEIKDYANAKTRTIAMDTTDCFNRFDKNTAIWTIKVLFERTGLRFPLDDKYWQEQPCTKAIVAALARIQDPNWLARQLRCKATREFEQLCRELGLVKRGLAPYLSDISLKRKLERKKSNRELLEKLVATNDLGQSYTLAELSDLGVSNPTLRRNELTTRLNGFEVWTEQDSRTWKAMCYTITTPSKFHPMTTRNKTPVVNKKYNYATPKDAQDYLNNVWQRIRAEAARQNIEYFGFRVTEPHHDGTPHWHILIFVLQEQESTLTRIIHDYALKEDSEEPGAKKQRFDALHIVPEKGRATGYIAKYIAKNIDGYNVDIDEEAQDYASISAIRAACWASLWGIRQFQQIGGAPVTVWRELRRMDTQESLNQLQDQHNEPIGLIKDIQKAADEGDWCQYMSLMGGATAKRKVSVRPSHLDLRCAGL